VTICLDIPVQLGLRRKVAGSGDDWNRMEQKALAYHDRVRAGYQAMAAAEPGRWVVVDATLAREQVQDALRQALAERLHLIWKQEGGMP
jgi:dTMP kinase